MGYDSTTDGYEVLKIDVDRNDGCKVSSEILSLKNGSRSKIDEHPSGICCVLYGRSSYLYKEHFIGSVFHESIL